MDRLIKALFVLSIGSWYSLLAAQDTVELPQDTVHIADFGLESQVPSAIDLVGPEESPAARNRASLVQRMRCWIDGVESCPVADRNDPRVREIRRFLTQGPLDRDASVVVHFPDQSRIEVRLQRASDLDPDDWDASVYEPVVQPETAQAPAMPAVPLLPAHLPGQ